MWLTICAIIILAVCLAMTWTEGLWTNTLSCINVFFAAMIATNYYELAANLMDETWGSLTYWWDFLSLWALFCFSFLVLRTFTDTFSKTRIRFKLPIDKIGGAIAGLCTGCAVVMFFAFTIHTAPLVRSPFGGAFQKEPTSTNLIVGPDRLWMGFMQSRSKGAMATSTEEADKKIFDENSEFILKYGQRRQLFSEQPRMKVRY